MKKEITSPYLLGWATRRYKLIASKICIGSWNLFYLKQDTVIFLL